MISPTRLFNLDNTLGTTIDIRQNQIIRVDATGKEEVADIVL